MKNNHERVRKKIRLQLYGWILFIVCALLFVIESAIKRDLIFMIASLLFLLGCFFFVVPVIQTLRRVQKTR
jgi:hypothetical protein